MFMKISFGIVTDGQQITRVNTIIDSIIATGIPSENKQIIVIGGDANFNLYPKAEKCIKFDESGNRGWITRKKNIIIQEASEEWIVFLHDYFQFDSKWYNKWIEFKENNDDFDVATNQILTLEGNRHSDWVVDPFVLWELYPERFWKDWDVLLPYTYKGLGRIQYISGGFWIAKKAFMEQSPLNEALRWGEAEDIEWSRQIRLKTTPVINPSAIVRIMKAGKWMPKYIGEDELKALLRHYNLTLLI
jgi:hypothetical protein